MFALVTLALFAPPQFSSPVEITQRFPRVSALGMGDFDGDGHADIVGASSLDGVLRLWIADGAGGFQAGTELPVVLGPVKSLSVGDLDGDGDLDLVAATIGPVVVWVENLGGGSFAGEMPLAGFGASLPGSIVSQRIVDFDRDGANDVLMTFDRSSAGQESLVLLASRINSPQYTVQMLISSVPALHDAEAADLDGDGDNDLVVGGADVGAWHRNDGGTLTGPIALPLFSGSTHERVGAADVDGDGDLDLVSLQCFAPFFGTVVYVSANDGAGIFSQQVPVSFSVCTLGYVLTDVDGDGRVDLLAADISGPSGRIELALGAPSGTFESPTVLVEGMLEFSAVTAGDLDGDGTPDLVMGTESGHVMAQEFLPASNPPVLTDTVIELTETVSSVFRDRLVGTGDFNRDGLQDVLVLATAEKKIAWWPADGSGGFDPLRTIERFQDVPRNAYVADVDGDGAPDVVHRDFATGAYRWHRGDGAGGFAAAIDVVIPFFQREATGFSDVDGDGLVDLLHAQDGAFSQLAWNRNLGGGTFGPRAFVSLTSDKIMTPRFEDVNGDGLTDLSYLLPDAGAVPAKFVSFAGTAPGVFNSAAMEFDLFTPFSYRNSTTWNVGDIDGDGEQDLIISVNSEAAPARNRLMLYQGLGGNQFGGVSVIAGSPQAALGLELSDLDGDGQLDIVTRIPLIPGQADGLVWYRQVAGGQFAPRQSLVSSRALKGEFLLGDFDGDGDGDAVFAEGLNDAIVRVETLFRGEIGVPYCSSAVANSSGAVGEMSASGSALPGVQDLRLTAVRLPLQSFGFFLASQTTDVVFAMNSVGVLCLGGAIGRFTGPGQVVSSGTTGSISIDAMPGSLPTPMGPTAALAGETWHFQAWHRDTVNGQATSNFTRAISVRFL